MQTEFIVIEVGWGRDGIQPFDSLAMDNGFASEEAAEAAILHYFNTAPSDLLGSGPILAVLKVFKPNS